MSKIVHFTLRGLQLFFTIIVLALVGNMIHDAIHGNPSVVNYQIFVVAFSLLSLIVLFFAAFRDGVVPAAAVLVLDALNALFFFAGAVALAAKLGVHSCSNQSYIKSNSVTNGSANMGKRCHEAKAADAFLFFAFFAYFASLILSAVAASNSGASLRGLRRPAMSQV